MSMAQRWQRLTQGVRALGRVDDLAHLSGEELATLATSARPWILQSGEELLPAGETAGVCFVVARGELVVRDGGDLGAVLGPGAVLGAPGVGWDGSSDVIATVDTEVLALDAVVFADAVDQSRRRLSAAAP